MDISEIGAAQGDEAQQQQLREEDVVDFIMGRAQKDDASLITSGKSARDAAKDLDFILTKTSGADVYEAITGRRYKTKKEIEAEERARIADLEVVLQGVDPSLVRSFSSSSSSPAAKAPEATLTGVAGLSAADAQFMREIGLTAPDLYDIRADLPPASSAPRRSEATALRKPVQGLETAERDRNEDGEGGAGGGDAEKSSAPSSVGAPEKSADQVLEEFLVEFTAKLDPSAAAKLDARQVGEDFINQFSSKFKEKSKEAVKSAVYAWWQNNWRRIARDSALAVGGALFFQFALPMLGGPALGFNLYTFAKEMGSQAALWPLAGTLVSGVMGSFRSALFSSARASLKGRNLLGAAVVQRTCERLGLGKPNIDAELLLTLAEVPVSVAMRPQVFKRAFLEPLGIWKPIVDYKKTLAEEFFWGTAGAAATKAAAAAAQRYGAVAWIGRAIIATAKMPGAILANLAKNETLRGAASRVRDVMLEGAKNGAEYMQSAVFRTKLKAALREDQADPRLQETARRALSDAVEAATAEADAELEEQFSEAPVERDYVRAALANPLPLPPPVVLASQEDSLFRSAHVSTLVGVGTTVAGWVAAAAALQMVGAPSVSELASVLPDEYAEFVARSAQSIGANLSGNVDVSSVIYTTVASSIGIGGLVKRLSGRIPLPQLRALERLSRRVSATGESLVGESSSALAREFMGIMLGTRVYTKAELERLTYEQLKELWVSRGGKPPGPSISSAALAAAILKNQKQAASTLHVELVEGLAAQATNAVGAAVIGGAARVAYSQAQGIYAAMADNRGLMGALGVDELSQRALSGMVGDATLDPYGLFRASARYSKEVAAFLEERGSVTLQRAYEAKRRLDEFTGTFLAAFKPAAGQQQQAPGISFPDVSKIVPEEGFETMEMFVRRMAGVSVNNPAAASELAAFNRQTLQALKEADLASEANFYAGGGLTARNTMSPFESPALDQRAFDAAKRLSEEVLKRTGDNVAKALDALSKRIDKGTLDKMLASALLGGLFAAPTTTAPVAQPQQLAPPQQSTLDQAPLEINKAAMKDLEGRYLDPLSDVLTMRSIELGLDAGFSTLAAFLNPAVAATAGGVGLYNQGAKWANRVLDFSTIVRAVALSLDATKDSVLAKMPKPTDFRLPEVGSFRELLQRLPLFKEIEEQRKIDVYGVVSAEVAKYAAALLPGQTRMTKFELFTNIATGLAGPVKPGLAEVTEKWIADVRDRLFEEDSRASTTSAAP